MIKKIAFSIVSRSPRCGSTGAVRSFRSSSSLWNSDIGKDDDSVEFDARELMRQHLQSIKVMMSK